MSSNKETKKEREDLINELTSVGVKAIKPLNNIHKIFHFATRDLQTARN